MFHAHGQTDMTKLIVAFRSFAKAPKNAMCVTDIALFPIYVKSDGATVALLQRTITVSSVVTVMFVSRYARPPIIIAFRRKIICRYNAPK